MVLAGILEINQSIRSDLYFSGHGIAVKTQDFATSLKYGLSWTFQSSPFRRDPILDKPESLVFFVVMEGNMATIYKPKKIKELVFKDPKLEYLKGKKAVVYADDFKGKE